MNIKLLRDLLTQRILFLDGAMGTEIQKFDLQNHDGNNDLLSLTNPKVISQIHEQYLIAGSDIIETNTFNANAISQKDYKNNISIFELNKTSATIAKELCKKYSSQAKPRFVAGAVGPTNISLSLSPDVNNQQYRAASFDELVSAYKEQILGLISGGVDLILVETIFDILNCRAAILAKHLAEQELSAAEILPIILSVTIDKFGRLLTGQTVETFLTSIKHTEGLIAIGFNCGLGAKELELQLQKLVEIKNRIAPELFISIYPNAGLPNENGTYDETAEEFVDTICKHSGLFNIVGGCCGTTPKHIELLNKKIGQTKNIQRSHAIPSCSANIGITLVGERTNINGSRKFLNTICNSDYNQAVDIAQQQIKDGAQIIDINLDNVLLPLETISTFLNILNCDPEISQIPFMLDSSNWETITRGIKHLIVKGIINSISLKNGEDDFIEKAKFIKLFGHQVVVMAIDEVGQATTEERKIEICSRAYNILTTKVNFPAKDIIFDTNILPIGTGIPEHNNYAIAFLSAVRWVKSNLPHAKTIAGLSNISFAFRGNDHLRKSIHSVFLHHATLFGLDFAILNPAQLLEYNNIDPQLKIKIENIIFNLSNNATEELIDYLKFSQTTTFSTDNNESKKIDVSSSPRTSIINSLMTGDNKDIAQNIYNLKDEFIAQGKTTLDILNDVLMPALQNISDKFANGELFLPQIIKSASVMKQAADCLELNKSNENSDVKQNYIGTILIATVKGDVHDIGKNIVAAVLECNGFKVIDLGIKVECEKIIDTAIKENVDAIALSGLISPSLEEMLNVVRELEKRKLSIPVIVGGATVTKKFVALRASPEYKSGFVVYAIDATQTSKIALELVSKNRDNFIKEIKFEYQQIYDCNDNNIHTQIETNFDYIASGYTPISPRNLGLIFINKNIKDIAEKIDWNTYYRAFRTNPNRENGDKQSEILKQDAFQIIEKLSEKNAKALGAVGIFPANSENDKIYIYNSFPKNIDTETSNQLDCLANIKTKKLDNRTTSIANFIAPKTSNIKDYIGLFALTFSSEVQEFIQEYKAEGNLYFAFGTELLVNALAETFSELLHREIAEKYWGYAGIKQQNIGIRPAPGYPALPDHSVKNTILSLLNAEMNIGITLTGNYAMLPTYSICGLYIAHPDAKM